MWKIYGITCLLVRSLAATLLFTSVCRLDCLGYGWINVSNKLVRNFFVYHQYSVLGCWWYCEWTLEFLADCEGLMGVPSSKFQFSWECQTQVDRPKKMPRWKVAASSPFSFQIQKISNLDGKERAISWTHLLTQRSHSFILLFIHQTKNFFFIVKQIKPSVKKYYGNK